MNTAIVKNLFEFWTYIGQITNTLTQTLNYKAVSMQNSDWPNRVFSIRDKKDLFSEIVERSSKGLLPDMITCTKPSELSSSNSVKLLFSQRNMALDLKDIKLSNASDSYIHKVESLKDAEEFAQVATKAFGYCIDSAVVYAANKDASKLRFFRYVKHAETLACGTVFFDSYNNVGLHLIGTVPKGRGQGIGNSITERLLSEAKAMNAKYCVLHASQMGENIYKKLGFIPYGELETYRVVESV